MARLIDADELFKEIATLSVDGSNPMGQGYCAGISDVSNLITNQPTIEPVKRGKWVNGDCSECGFPIPTDDKIGFIKKDEVHYCYNCGAKMDGEIND